MLILFLRGEALLNPSSVENLPAHNSWIFGKQSARLQIASPGRKTEGAYRAEREGGQEVDAGVACKGRGRQKRSVVRCQ